MKNKKSATKKVQPRPTPSKKPNQGKVNQARSARETKGNVMRKPDSTKVMAMRWKHQVDNDSVREVANSFAQYAMSLGYSPPVADTNANDLIDFYVVVIQEIHRAMGGRIYLLQKHPLHLREIMDAVFPKVDFTGKLSVSCDPESIQSTITESSDMHWGRLNGEYGTTGCTELESPAIPSATEELRLAAAARVIEKMEQAGNKTIDRSVQTTFLKDTSAFSNVVEDTDQQDLRSLNGRPCVAIIGSEVPIRHLWLAALRLIKPSKNRMTVGKHYRVYAPPGAYVGHRLVAGHTGFQGRLDNIRLQRLDIDFETLIQGYMCDSINTKFLESASVEGTVDPPYLSGDSKAFRAYVQMAVLTQFFNESPVTWGLKTSGAAMEQRSLPWGNQFRERGNAGGATLREFWLNSEIKKRLHRDPYKDDEGVINYTYTVPMVGQAVQIVAHPVTWDADVPVFPPAFDTSTFTEGTKIVTNCDTVFGSYAQYLDTLMVQLNAANPFVDSNPIQRTHETIKGQHLGRVARVSALVEIELLKQRVLGANVNQSRNAALNLKIFEDGLTRGNDVIVRRVSRNDKVSSAVVGQELEVGILTRVPDLNKVAPFFGVNLPKVSTTLQSADSLAESISFAANRSQYSNYSLNKSVRDPVNGILATYAASLKSRSKSASSDELSKLLRSKEDVGAGGLFTKLGTLADSVAGAFFPDSTVSKMA